MIAEQSIFYLPNQLKSTIKFTFAPFFLLLVLLNGCSDEGGDDSNLYDEIDRYKGLLEVVNVSPSDTASSVEVKVTILYDGGEVTAGKPYFDNEVETTLQWACKRKEFSDNEDTDFNFSSAGNGEVKVNIAKGSGSVSHTFDDLPAQPSSSDEFMSIDCEVIASVEIIPPADGDRKFIDDLNEHSANVYSGGFWKKDDGQHVDDEEHSDNMRNFTIEKEGWQGGLNVKLEVTKITAGVSGSLVDMKVSVLKDGKPVKKGDAAFDLSFDLEIWWSYAKSNDIGNHKTVIKIDKDKGQASAVFDFPTQQTGSFLATSARGVPYRKTDIDGNVTTERSGSGNSPPIIGVSRIVIGERSYAITTELTVALTSKEESKPLVYRITDKGSGAEISTVDMNVYSGHKQNCANAQLVHLATNKGSIKYGTWVDGVSGKSDGHVFIVGSGTSCILMALAGKNVEKQHGESSGFSINTASAPFTITTQAQVTPKSGSFTGKISVFAVNDTGSSKLVGYLNASSITAATKLKASAANDANNVASLSAGKYMLLVEQATDTSMYIIEVR